MTVNLQELREAEKLIYEISYDSRHPVNNPEHPDYALALRTLNKLISKVAETRAMLDAESNFKF